MKRAAFILAWAAPVLLHAQTEDLKANDCPGAGMRLHSRARISSSVGESTSTVFPLRSGFLSR